MQKLVVGQEIELIPVGGLPSALTGVDQLVPFQDIANPLPPTAMQKLVVGHEIELMKLAFAGASTVAAEDH